MRKLWVSCRRCYCSKGSLPPSAPSPSGFCTFPDRRGNARAQEERYSSRGRAWNSCPKVRARAGGIPGHCWCRRRRRRPLRSPRAALLILRGGWLNSCHRCAPSLPQPLRASKGTASAAAAALLLRRCTSQHSRHSSGKRTGTSRLASSPHRKGAVGCFWSWERGASAVRVRLLGATFAQAPEAASPGKQMVVNWRLGCRFFCFFFGKGATAAVRR